MIDIDWISDADKEIRELHVELGRLSRVDIAAIIAKHWPFEPGVAYMLVPRCETCAHWMASTQECGALRTGPLNVIFTAPDFGCVKWKKR